VKRFAAVLLLVLGFRVHAADSGVTNLVITPTEVDPKSVKLIAAESRQPNAIFYYVNKTPEQVRAIYRHHPAVLFMQPEAPDEDRWAYSAPRPYG